MAVNAEKLRQIQEALTREFTNPTTSPCTPQRVHFVYAHTASVVDAHNLAPIGYPDFETRVEAWTFPTATRYEACGIIKQNAPYRDFIRARFLWKERADVKLTELPSNADPPTATAADGGTLIMIHDNSPTLGAATAQTVKVKVELPAQEAPPTGYPTIRRVCLSVPGQVGHHGEVNTPDAPGTNSVTLEYPERAHDTDLHVVGEMPWFRFEYPRGTRMTEDPWLRKINYDVTPVGDRGHVLYESASQTVVGSVVRYAGHYGIVNYGNDSKEAVRRAFASELSSSRRLVLSAVMDVEGGPSAVGSCDGPKVSWGMNQWTWPARSAAGELHQIMAYVYDFFPDAFDRCFGRYGIGISFQGRNPSWSPTAYRSPVIFHVPCCATNVRGGLNQVGQHLQVATEHGTIATAFGITDRSDTTTVAFMFLLHKAGLDAEIQKAQVQWTSFRITYGMRNLHNPSNEEALSGFLVSLGSNMPAADRLAHARNGIAEGQRLGIQYPSLNAPFSDTGTVAEWRDWPTRCSNAGKETTGQAQRPAGQAQRPAARPQRPRRPQART